MNRLSECPRSGGRITFITELIEHFRGQPAKLKRKYAEELHANEVALLPYYVANLNIEATYAAITGEYIEFPGLCLVDTLDNTAGLGKKTGDQVADLFGMGDENVERIKRQNKRKISVIIGNPPYNANQANENDNNKNREYLEIDRRIKDSYIKASTAQKTKLYDMYSRFFRWASDRLHDDGILAFITNRSFLDARTFDGFRKVVAQEFAEIRVVDLGGDVRANPKLSGTKHNVFGIQTGVAISFLVKKRSSKGARIFYTRRPEMETAEEKRLFLVSSPMRGLAMEEVRPDKGSNWLSLTSNDFDELLPLASKDAQQRRRADRSIFKNYSIGISTNRDEWVIAESDEAVSAKMRFFAEYFANHPDDCSETAPVIKWSRNLKRRQGQGRTEPFEQQFIRRMQYRPYFRQSLYDSRLFVDERGKTDRTFFASNITIAISGPGSSKPFQALAAADAFGVDYLEKTQALPFRIKVDSDGADNITDWALKQFKEHYPGAPPFEPSPASRGRGKSGRSGGTSVITKQAIFHYVYAVLHDPLYREKYAQNLKREFPRIPLYGSDAAAFWQWAEWGERLMALHLGYESVESWPLSRTDIPDEKARAAAQSPKPMLKADKDGGRLVLDSETTLAGVPPEAWDYKLGNRSALEWILDQHKESKPKDPTIRERFNTYRFADHKERVVDLLLRVTRVSVETQAIIKAMRTTPRN